MSKGPKSSFYPEDIVIWFDNDYSSMRFLEDLGMGKFDKIVNTLQSVQERMDKENKKCQKILEKVEKIK